MQESVIVTKQRLVELANAIREKKRDFKRTGDDVEGLGIDFFNHRYFYVYSVARVCFGARRACRRKRKELQ